MSASKISLEVSFVQHTDGVRSEPSSHRKSRYLEPHYAPSQPSSRHHKSTTSRTPRSLHQPTVEDEDVSLAREANGGSVLRKSEDGVKNRGDIDQWPIIQDLEPHSDGLVTSSATTSALSSFSGYETGTASTVSETHEPRGRQPSTCELMDLPEIPDLSRRQPSPYVYAPKIPKAVHVADDSAYSSPEVKVAETRRTELPFRSNVLQEIERNKRSMSTASSRAQSEDVYIVEDRKPSRYSLTGQGLGEHDRRTSPWQSVLSLSGDEQSTRNARHYTNASATRTPPSYSPNLEPSRPPRNTPPQSGYSSGSQSRSNSRPVSPTFSYAPRSSESPRGSRSFPSGSSSQDHPVYPTSRLATTSFPPTDYHTSGPLSMPDMPGLSTTLYGTSAPYPTDSPTNLMPSEHHFRVQNDNSRAPPALHTSQTYPITTSEHRIPAHHRTNSSSFVLPIAAAALTRQVPSRPLSPPNLTPCYRHQPDFHNDWLTFRDSPYILICPTCFASTFNTSLDLRPHCVPASPQSHDRALTCAFASPWMRLALLQTHHAQSHFGTHPDLRLIYQISHLSATSLPCPGEYKVQRQWYTLRHKGHRISGFNVCAGCIARVEALVPAVRGLWEESKSSGKERRCALWSEGRRWGVFMDELVEAGRKAEEKNRIIRLGGLAELAEG